MLSENYDFIYTSLELKNVLLGGMHTYVIKLKKTQEVVNTACRITEKVWRVLDPSKEQSALYLKNRISMSLYTYFSLCLRSAIPLQGERVASCILIMSV